MSSIFIIGLKRCQDNRTIQNNKANTLVVTARPMCPPAWRLSTRHRAPWQHMRLPKQKSRPRTTQNCTKETTGEPGCLSGPSAASRRSQLRRSFQNQASPALFSRPDEPKKGSRFVVSNQLYFSESGTPLTPDIQTAEVLLLQ